MKIEFKLTSSNKKELAIIDDFCNLIVSNIKSDILNNTNLHKLSLYEDSIINADWIDWIRKPKYINMAKLIRYIVNHITYKSRKKHRYIIYIDNKLIPNSKTPIDRLARFLDKGNEEYKGTFFISKVFMKYSINIDKYWKSYCSLRLKRLSVSEVVSIR